MSMRRVQPVDFSGDVVGRMSLGTDPNDVSSIGRQFRRLAEVSSVGQAIRRRAVVWQIGFPIRRLRASYS